MREKEREVGQNTQILNKNNKKRDQTRLEKKNK